MESAPPTITFCGATTVLAGAVSAGCLRHTKRECCALIRKQHLLEFLKNVRAFRCCFGQTVSAPNNGVYSVSCNTHKFQVPRWEVSKFLKTIRIVRRSQ